MHNAFNAAAVFALVAAIGTGLLLIRRDREPIPDAIPEPA